jgi:hypothetical protein
VKILSDSCLKGGLRLVFSMFVICFFIEAHGRLLVLILVIQKRYVAVGRGLRAEALTAPTARIDIVIMETPTGSIRCQTRQMENKDTRPDFGSVRIYLLSTPATPLPMRGPY